MPRLGRFFKKRRFRKRKLRYRRKRVTVSTVKRLISRTQEQKVFHSQATNITVYDPTTTVPILLFSNFGLLPQGTADEMRVGDRVQVKHFRMWYDFHTDDAPTGSASTPGIPIMFRIIVFLWKPESTTDTAYNPQITGSDVCGGVLAPYSIDNKQMYKILYDSKARVIVNDQSNTVKCGYVSRYLKSNFVQFQSTALASGLATNKIYVWVNAVNPRTELAHSPVFPQCKFNLQLEYRYTDA